MTKPTIEVYDDKTYTGELIPPDLERCQFEQHKREPFRIGAPNGWVVERCEAKPAVVATEKEPMNDGRHGAMSLCQEHWDMLESHRPGFATFERIK